MTAPDPSEQFFLNTITNYLTVPLHSPTSPILITFNLRPPNRSLSYHTLHKQYKNHSTMNALLQRTLRPASRRAHHRLVAPLATAVPARWQSNTTGGAPFDPVVRGEMGVGELEGAEFKIEPLRRTGEDPETMRARLTCMFSFCIYLSLI